jgi:hypothetical protein
MMSWIGCLVVKVTTEGIFARGKRLPQLEETFTARKLQIAMLPIRNFLIGYLATYASARQNKPRFWRGLAFKT